MDTTRQSLRRLRTIMVSLLLAVGLVLTLPACSGDPILGPDEGEPDDSGGSYSSINQLAPADSAAPEPRTTNPERF
jgi:hypothetical protein